MKKILFSILFLTSVIFSNKLIAQATLFGTAGLHYILDSEDFRQSFALVYDNVPIALCGPTKASINVSNGHIYVDIWRFKSASAGCIGAGINSMTPIRNHVIEITDDRKTLGDPTYVLKLPLKAWEFAVNTIPVRFRPAISNANIPKTSTVSTQFNLAASFGPTFGYGAITTRGITTWTFTPNVFLGPTSTGTTTAAPTVGTNSHANNILLSQNNFALSYGLSAIFARNSIGVLIAFGIDTELSKGASVWPYQNKPWIGIGVSTSMLK